MKTTLFLIACSIFFTACSSMKPPLVEYRINVPNIDKKVQDSTCNDKSLKIAQAFSPSYLISLNINYVQGKNKQFAYSQSKWADSPNRFVTVEIEKLLRDMDLFKTVQVSKSRSRSDLILETNIEEFMQYFNEDSSKSYAKVSIVFTLIDSVSAKVVASRDFKAQVDTQTLDAQGGVKALSIALGEVLQNSASWFEEVCK